MDAFHKKIGKKIKTIREKTGLSQEALAHSLGINRVAVSQIENGVRQISAKEIAKLSQTFNIQADILLDLEKDIEVILEQGSSTSKPRQRESMRISVPQKNVEKFKEALLYILKQVGSKPNIGQTVLYKLLYFIDFNFYEKYEEQLIGATYQKNHFGPTPIEFAKIVDEMEECDLVTVKSKYFQKTQTKYLPLREPDLSKFKGHEIDMINEVIKELSDMNATQISEYSHKDVPWLTTDDGDIIDYESVFYREAPYSVRSYSEEDIQ
jgi:transcriptional regulator with XRE-family HTH domain